MYNHQNIGDRKEIEITLINKALQGLRTRDLQCERVKNSDHFARNDRSKSSAWKRSRCLGIASSYGLLIN